MRKILILSAIFLGAIFTACQEDSIKTFEKEYIMFQDTLSYKAVLQDKEYFTVPVTSTVACDYDWTLAVVIVVEGSNAV